MEKNNRVALENIKATLRDKGMKVKTLANIMGKTYASVYQVLNRTGKPSVATVRGFADALKMTDEDLYAAIESSKPIISDEPIKYSNRDTFLSLVKVQKVTGRMDEANRIFPVLNKLNHLDKVRINKWLDSMIKTHEL